MGQISSTSRKINFWEIWDVFGMMAVFVALFILCSFTIDGFLSAANMEGLTLAVSTIGIVACTMLFCLASGDFDLSVGSVLACSGVLSALVTVTTGSVVIGALAGVCIGGLVGLFNGIVIAFFRINALITTLATMQIVRGLALLFADGKSIFVPNPRFCALGTGNIAGVPVPVLILVVFFIFFGLLLGRTVFGRNTLAIGGNKEAAHLAGIRVRFYKIMIFSMQGVVAGFAGVILASRMEIGDPKVGVSFELQVISACVLGGVSLTGGVGSMIYVVSGVLIMGTVENAMNLTNVPTFWQYVVRGGILLTAVLFDQFRQNPGALRNVLKSFKRKPQM
ncbi:L-arabinose ABC transporter permease AraH [Candidatus Sumerlaeota bacterium]|nr:L-arabinose ABC transporter permease AraH [Candidatus Sumerlaeota bacterium]